MKADLDPLFTPFKLNGVTLPNRFVMAPMTRSRSPGQVPGDDVAAYYRRRVEGGVGLIITEGTSPDHPVATNDDAIPRFHGEDAFAGWRKVVAAVKSAGGHIMPQLWHVGMARRPGQGRNPELPPVGPSGLFKPGKRVTDPMTDAEIADVIAAFAKAAGDARRLGFDGIELHGAHGYIIDQFFWNGTNERTDRYGGDLVMRTRFAAEIIRAARRAAGPDFPIVLRWSQWKQQDFKACLAPQPKLLEAFLAPLVDAGVDAFHCSTRRFWESEFAGSDMNLAGWVKKLVGTPTITVGSVGLDIDFLASQVKSERDSGGRDLSRLTAMFERGEFDLVAIGRALISNPDWVTRQRSGGVEALRPYDPAHLETLV